MIDYLTVVQEREYSLTVRRSKFICLLFPVKSVDDGLGRLPDIKKRYPSATHYCYAIIGTPQSNEFKFSDAGEPSGTAGQPILGVLQKSGLYEVAAVVIRYFGGVKLGAGGLVSAYAKATAQCVKEAALGEKRYSSVLKVNLSYTENQSFISRITALELKVLDTQYGDSVQTTFAIPEIYEGQATKILTEITSGAGQYVVEDKKYVLYER